MECSRLIVLAICLLLACVQANDVTSAPTKTTPTTPTPTKTTPTTPTTSLAPTTSTTAAPSTTTTKPTEAPTTPKPQPIPKPEKGSWAYTNVTDSKTCVIVQMALQFNVTYETKDAPAHAIFNLPRNDTKVKEGYCGEKDQNITLWWPANKQNNNTLTFVFEKNATTNKFSLTKLEAAIYQDNVSFPDSKNLSQIIELSNNASVFSVPLTMSYRCGKMQNITFTDKTSMVLIDNVQMQAFHADKGTLFGSAVDCDYVDVPDIVPIAVGCALGGLVLIVLIAYLVGRRRNRARGYLSM